MPKYRVKSTLIMEFEAEIEAENEKLAYEIARDLDGGAFTEISDAGDWTIDYVEPLIEEEQPS